MPSPHPAVLSEVGSSQSADLRNYLGDGMAREVNALTVHQWLPTWEAAEFSASEFRRRPPEHFYLLSVPAATLRALVGIYRRSAKSGRARARDLGIQRVHDSERSDEIREFVQYGFPWSGLSQAKRASADYQDLIKPGWLPTAVVVNILTPDDARDGEAVHPQDLLKVRDRADGTATVVLPDVDANWKPKRIAPIEVIDGQHRLWAFDKAAPDYELPVVAFHGLDRSWQAYLFYTINIKPKRINTSLAYDLYPLLRTEDWLEKFEGHSVYRETRAQELTEALWSHPSSPWHDRINMLGERGTRSVTQASWVRSLLATIVKSWEGRRVQIGGLFGAPVGANQLVLPWTRAQQAAFLIHAWRSLREAIRASDSKWAEALRDVPNTPFDPAFEGSATLLNTDIGVRGVLYIVNDLCYVDAERLALAEWQLEDSGGATSERAVSTGLKSIRATAVGRFLGTITAALADYDWRASKAPGLTEADRRLKSRFRGGTGYRELREDLLRHLTASASDDVSTAADSVFDTLGYGDASKRG